eukprot:TRINITY_DN12387_c0_g1_i1.p2 TRINITY_DN12387_c0_g1~~TRINITY_DN12387_c0_g1_i1.p2  ORF type:complete len:162 (-),score=25.79 TRINITY_DN12387_c0_g1_i1:506-991(-)
MAAQTCTCGRNFCPDDSFCGGCGSKRLTTLAAGFAPPVPTSVASGEVAIDPMRVPACDDPSCNDASCELPTPGVVPGGGQARFEVRVDKPLSTRPGSKPAMFVHDAARTVEALVEDDQQPAFSVLWETIGSTGFFKAYFRARLGTDGLVYIDTSRLLQRAF